MHCFRQDHPHKGNREGVSGGLTTSLGLTRSFQVDRVTVIPLEEAEATIRSIQAWGLLTWDLVPVTPFWT